MTESPLEAAQRHVREGRSIVAAQEALVIRIRASGRDVGPAEDLLSAFRSTLALFEGDLLYFRSRYSN